MENESNISAGREKNAKKQVNQPTYSIIEHYYPFLCPSRKEQHLLSSVNCWYLVLNQTRRESRDHATLNDIYINNVIVRLAQISEDVIRLFKKVCIFDTLLLFSHLFKFHHNLMCTFSSYKSLCSLLLALGKKKKVYPFFSSRSVV